MTIPIGKFDVRPDIRLISRWGVEMRQSRYLDRKVSYRIHTSMVLRSTQAD